MFRDIRECEAHGDDFKASAVQRELALEDRLPESLLQELQNRMFQTYDAKLAFVQHRVELDHQQLLRPSATGLSRLERPGGLFDGGYEDSSWGPAAAPAAPSEDATGAVTPEDYAQLAALQSAHDPTGLLAPQIAALSRKIGQDKKRRAQGAAGARKGGCQGWRWWRRRRRQGRCR